MAGSLNKVTLIGNVGADPEVRNLNSGSSVANFSLATSESWKDKATNEKKEVTQWHRIVVWNDGLISVIEKYVSKGSKVYIEGQLQTRKYEKDGVDHYATEVVLTGFDAKLILLGDSGGGGNRDPNDNASRPGNSQRSSGGNGYRDQSGGREEEKDRGRQDGRGNFSKNVDDDIPF